MPSDIQRQLALVRLQSRQPLVVREAEGEVVRAFKEEMKQQRAMIIKALSDVSAFGPLDPQALVSMADATSHRDVSAGGVVAAQDDTPKEFFIVASGIIRVSRRALPAADNSASVGDQEVNRLYAGSHFSAGALLTGEQYTTTYEAVGPVTLAVMSAEDFYSYTDRAIAIKSKDNVDEATPTKDPDAAEEAAGDVQSFREEAVNRVPIFAPLSPEQKRLVASALLQVHFRPGMYICEEGKLGSSFHIIMAGTCRVTIHDPNAPNHQREVTKLHKDDFFGEVALMESGLRTATVVAETDVTCLSLTRRHFDLYLTPIKAAILDGAAAKEILDMKGDDENFDDELDDDFDTSAVKGVQKTGPRTQSKGSKGVENEDAGAARGHHMATSRTGKVTDRNVQAYGDSLKRRRRLSTFRGVAAHALRVKRRRRKWFNEEPSDTSAKLCSSSAEARATQTQEARRQGVSLGQSSHEMEFPASGTDSRGRYSSKATMVFRSLARSMAFSLENDLYATLLDEMIERPTGLPEFNKIVSEVFHERVWGWEQAYSRIRDTAHCALGKGTKRLRDGELAVLAAMLRLNPVLRKRHCSNWPEHEIAELCKSMHFMEVRSLDRVFVHGTHGTKCYVLLRGFARILHPVEGENEIVRFRPDGDVRPGDVVGDSVLDGVLRRSSTVIAVTDCEFAAFDDSEFNRVKDQGPSQMSVEEKCQYLRGFNLMRNSTTYHLYKIALMARPLDVAKDSVILKAGEPSKALYFIIEGTVEVIQMRKKHTSAASGDCGRGGVSDGHGDTRDGGNLRDDGGGRAVMKMARRVLTVLESGEYFGESGIIAFFKSGNKVSSFSSSSAVANLVTEQFYIVAGTHVELLVLRRKHFNIIDMPMLDILKANCNARLLWRAQRKLEAYRGRAVLRAAKKALDQAAVEVGSFEDRNDPAQSQTLSQERSFNGSDAGSLVREKDVQRTQWERGTARCGSVEQEVGAGLPSRLKLGLGREEMKIGDSEGSKTGACAAEDVSLAGLTLASKDSLPYSLDSKRFPIPRRDQAISDSGNVQALTEDEQSTAGIHHDHCHYDRQTISRKLPSLQAGAYESCPGMKQSFASLSLPSLGVSMGASWPNEVDRIDGRVDSEKHDQNVQPAASMRRRVWGRSGDPHDDGCLAYAGHKQPGLHGSKSFGAFWGETEASGARQTNIELMSRLPGRGNRLHTNPWERYDARENGVIEPNVLRHHPLQTQEPVYRLEKMWGAPGSGGPPAANEAIKGGNTLRCQGLELSRSPTVAVPTISKKRQGKKGAALVPVRGISRVVANAS